MCYNMKGWRQHMTNDITKNGIGRSSRTQQWLYWCHNKNASARMLDAPRASPLWPWRDLQNRYVRWPLARFHPDPELRDPSDTCRTALRIFGVVLVSPPPAVMTHHSRSLPPTAADESRRERSCSIVRDIIEFHLEHWLAHNTVKKLLTSSPCVA